MKSILFLSALDFKEKSIQVIKKTPEAYAERNWDVTYLVARDTSISGNYSYEDVINPKRCKVHRFNFPLTKVQNKIKFTGLNGIIRRIRTILVIKKLFIKGLKLTNRNHFDVIYGYEGAGVIASYLIRLVKGRKKFKYIHRFQGTYFMKYLREGKYHRFISEWELIISMSLPANLVIMTNDGTEGDKALKKINKKVIQNDKLRFYVNGVDEIERELPRTELNQDTCNILSVVRLIKWKRLDRSLNIIYKLKQHYPDFNFHYYLVGEGSEKNNLLELANKLKITDKVSFLGPKKHNQVYAYYNDADLFLSMNDLSNVGNPLLEAIRYKKIILTLNNGDTGSWIKHKKNGFIYNPDSKEFYDQAAHDIYDVYHSTHLISEIKNNLIKTNIDKLWTWEERFNQEVHEVQKLLP